MRLKKVLAIMMAATLASSSMTAFASELTTPGSGSDITIDGGSTVVETTKYLVTLPTSSSLNFNLDPQGVYGYFNDSANSSATSVSKDDLAGYAGKVVGSGADSIINKSSVPIVVTCDYKLTSTASALTVVDADDDVTDDGNEVYLAIVGGTVGSDGKFTAGAADQAFELAIGTEATTATVALDAADYEFVKESDGSFSYKPSSDSGATTETKASLSITGALSKDGDWSELEDDSKKLTLSCVYSFVGAKDISGATIASGFVTAGADSITYLTSSSLSGTYSKATGSAFSINPGFTVTTATVIAKPGTDNLSTALNTTTHYTVKDGVFYLKTAWVSGLTNGEWKIELSDGSTTKVLTLTVTD